MGAVASMPTSGYRLDEEITFAVVPAMTGHGLPALPSGILYLRGLPYSWAAWLAGLVFGQTPATYRYVSLTCALAAVILLFQLGRELSGSAMAVAAVVLLACFPPFLAVAGFARPYSLFVALFVLSVWMFFRACDGRASYAGFLAGLAVCRLCHEFGAALVLLPMAGAIVSDSRSGHRSRLFGALWKSIVVVVTLELLLYAATQASLTHLFVPLSAAPAFRPVRLPPFPPLHVFSVATPWSVSAVIVLPIAVVAALMVRRTGAIAAVSMCAALGALFQLGLIVVFLCLSPLIQPRRAGRYIAIAAVFFTLSLLLWTLHTILRTDAQPAWSIAASLAGSTIRYPMSALRYFAERWPLTAGAMVMGAVSIVYRGRHGGGTESARVIAVFVMLVVFGLGAFNTNLQPRFFVLALPAFLMLAANALPLPLVAVVAAWQMAYGGGDALRSIRAPIGDDPAATLICSEELACRHLFGRVDYLLIVDAADLADYAGRRNGELRGLYANAPVISTAADLEQVLRSPQQGRPFRIVVLKTGKVEEQEILEIVEDVGKRFDGRRYSDDDVTIVYLGQTATGSSDAAERAATVRLALTSPSMISR